MTDSLADDSFEAWPSLTMSTRRASAIVIAEVVRIERLISNAADPIEKSRRLNDFSAAQLFMRSGQAEKPEDLATAAAIAILSLALHDEVSRRSAAQD